MKKYLLLIFALFFIVGCSIDKNNVTENTSFIPEKTEDILPSEPIYIDENPIIVGLYQNGKLIREINTRFNTSSDITVLNVYFTNLENVNSSNIKYNFNEYASSYDNVNKYKIGFQVSFIASDEEITKVITGPKDMYILSPYIFNYLYDDVHQNDGAWYSHVEENQVNDTTVYSSIKLYATDDVYKISSPITLTVFTYDTMDDFNDNGLYRGNSKYTITIKNET